jgi:hypothetical protein
MTEKIICEEVNEIMEINGVSFDVSFDRDTTISHDTNYGADADGNRGTSVYFIEEDVPSNVFINGRPIKSYPFSFREKAFRTIYKWMEENDARVE